jgi:hypothetical protein
MPTSVSSRHPAFVISCVNCGNALIAPSKSEYDDIGHIRHMWTCSRCSNCFASLEQIAIEEMTSDDVVGWDGA